MRLSITAPEITLIVVKLAASMSPCLNASRHNKELAANASIATVVSNAMLREIDLKVPERIAATLISIYDASDSEENFHSLTLAILPLRATRIGELGNSEQSETVINIDPQSLPSIKGDHATTDYHSSPE